ncbi:MAG: hypothetical protein LUC98_05260 [Lachnospiraceae bacterium]|nr:hypothetical protein [Lachnospiraceae bacterium]
MKLTEKAKRYLAVGGGVLVCVGLITAISMQFGKDAAVEDVLEEEAMVKEIIVDPGDYDTDAEEDGEMSIDAESGTSAEEAEVAVDSRPAQTDLSEQSIQEDVTKPEEPSEEALTDPSVMPDGTEVEGEPVAVDHDDVAVTAETGSSEDEPQAGATENGQIYIPGFGWVENEGGGSSGTVAGDMYENGNKIGSMD